MIETNNLALSFGNPERSVALWDFLTGGNWVNVFFLLLFLISLAYALYHFFIQYFYLKRNLKIEANLLPNIADFLHDGRTGSAMDYCKSLDSIYSRMFHKGLERLGRPIADISTAMQLQIQFEKEFLMKSIHKFSFLWKISFILGCLGSSISLSLLFLDQSKMEHFNFSFIFYSLFIAIEAFLFSALLLAFYSYLKCKSLEINEKQLRFSIDILHLLNKPSDVLKETKNF